MLERARNIVEEYGVWRKKENKLARSKKRAPRYIRVRGNSIQPRPEGSWNFARLQPDVTLYG